MPFAFAGSMLKVKFFSMTNIDRALYAKFDVISPKKVLYENKIINLAKLGEYSKSLKDGLFVGVEQTKKDSLFTAKDTTRTWTTGHNGYFTLFDALLTDQSDGIRKLLEVDKMWDAEWDTEDVLDKLTEEQIQAKIAEIKEYTKQKTKVCLSCGAKISVLTTDNLCKDCNNIQQLNNILSKAGLDPVIVTTSEDFESTIKNIINSEESKNAS